MAEAAQLPLIPIDSSSSGYGSLDHPADRGKQSAVLHQGLSQPMVILAIIKGVIGPAVLYMPYGFIEGGYAFSMLMLGMSWLLFSWGMYGMLQVWSHHKVSYMKLMEMACGETAAAALRLVIMANQMCLAVSYLIFVATNLVELTGLSHATLVYIQLLVHIPTSWIRNVESFQYSNLCANLLIGLSLCTIIAVGVSHADMSECHLQWFNPDSYYEFIGTSVFVWEGMSVLAIPIQAATITEQATKYPPLFVIVTFCISAGYSAFALLNVCAYGSDTQLVLTTNLPAGPLKQSVQLVYCIAVTCTLPLQMNPALALVSDMIVQALSHSRLRRYCGSTSIRAADLLGRSAIMVLLCAVASVLVDALPKVVAVVGSLFGVPLAFIFPSLVSNILMPASEPWPNLRWWINSLVVVAGTLICVVTLNNCISL